LTEGEYRKLFEFFTSELAGLILALCDISFKESGDAKGPAQGSLQKIYANLTTK